MPQQLTTFDPPESYCFLWVVINSLESFCGISFKRTRYSATSVLRLLRGEVTSPRTSYEWVSFTMGQLKSEYTTKFTMWRSAQSKAPPMCLPQHPTIICVSLATSGTPVFLCFKDPLHTGLWGRIYGLFMLQWYHRKKAFKGQHALVISSFQAPKQTNK